MEDAYVLRDDVLPSLYWLQEQCHLRRMADAGKWASEMIFNLAPDDEPVPSAAPETSRCQSNRLNFVRSLMDNGEFARAAHFTEPPDLEVNDNVDHLSLFIHYYSLYLDGEKRMLDSLADVTDKKMRFANEQLPVVQRALEELYKAECMDAFLLYLYGVVLSALQLTDQVVPVLVQAINAQPALWPAWHALVRHINTKNQLCQLSLPEVWMKDLFMGECFVSLQMEHEAIDAYDQLKTMGFGASSYVMTQMAVALHHATQYDDALEVFQMTHERDKYRLEHMYFYSNSLFVKCRRVELSVLAHHCFNVNKYSPETCNVVGNYYSLRGDHERSVTYFQRALKLDPTNVGAWTLMGHEFMELKNTAAACLAYHNALEIDENDCRAWYGLGQMYDILRMPSHALYYYNRAHKCRPLDSRMIIALGEMYQKTNKIDRAMKCYWKAHSVGDIEGTALLKLGKLFEKECDSDQASACYLKFLAQLEEDANAEDPVNQPACYKFLAGYYISKKRFEEAHTYAHLCLEYDATKEDGKSLLKAISQSRSSQPTPTTEVDKSDSMTKTGDDSSMMIE